MLRILSAVVFLSSLGLIGINANDLFVRLQVVEAEGLGASAFTLTTVLTLTYYVVVAVLSGVFWLKLRREGNANKTAVEVSSD